MKNSLANRLFDLTVEGLQLIADFFGVSYETINILIYVILQPLLTLLLIVGIIYYHKKNKKQQQVINQLIKQYERRN